MQPARLASLISSHLCHDLVSPVSALTTALELMEDASHDRELMSQAMDLLANSTQQARAKLELFRVAYGAGGSIGGTQVEFAKIEPILTNFFAVAKPDFVWLGAPAMASKNAVKLMLNLCLIGLDSLPRGGEVRAGAVSTSNGLTLQLRAEGPRAGMKAQTQSILSGSDAQLDQLEPHNIQPFYARCIAAEEGSQIEARQYDEVIELQVQIRG